MKITLTSLTYAERLSQETNAFDANLVIDGKTYGRVGNAGHGGCHHYSSQEGERLLDEYAKTLPMIETDMQDPHDPTKKFCYPQSADSLVDAAFSVALAERDLKRHLGRKILFTIPGKPGLYQTKAMTAATVKDVTSPPNLEATKAKLKAETILNALPFEQALEVYRARA